jgi:Flp pilus assembly protein TadD
MGRAFAGAGRLEQALQAFRMAETLDPYDADIAADHAAALEQAGHAGEAIEAYRRAIEQEPEVAEYHQLLAAALERAGRTEDAEKHFGEARRLSLRP